MWESSGFIPLHFRRQGKNGIYKKSAAFLPCRVRQGFRVPQP